MSHARAIATGDVTLLPGRRDEDWRWTDLRGQIRTAPAISPVAEASGAGPFAGEQVVIVNGRPATTEISIPAGQTRTLVMRFVSQADHTAHHAAVRISVATGATLTLLESYEGAGEGYIADAVLDIRLGEGATVERVVLAADTAGAISVSTTDVALSAKASFSQTVLTDGARRQRLETRVRHPGQGASVRLDGGIRMGPR